LVQNYVLKPGLSILAVYVVIAMALAAGINALIVFSEAAEWTESLTKPSFALSGLQIGLVWEVLFACLATAFWLIRRTPPLPNRRAASTALAALFLVILSFPFYAILPQHLLNAFVGTLGSAFIAWVVTFVVLRNSRKAGVMVLPLALWLSFASVIAYHVYRLNHPQQLLQAPAAEGPIPTDLGHGD
jgi:translocator protein